MGARVAAEQGVVPDGVGRVGHPIEHLAGVGEVGGGRARVGADREEPGDEGRVRGEAGLDGGGVELDERAEAGAVREVREERVLRRRVGFGGKERGRRGG